MSPFQNHTADEPGTGRREPWEGVSAGADSTIDSRAIAARLEATPDWPKFSQYLGEHRVMLGTELNGRRIATIICKDGRSYDYCPLDGDGLDIIVHMLYREVSIAMECSGLSRLERFLRYGRKAIE